MVGYASAEYAWSLAEFGEPLALSAAGGWLLGRRLPVGEGHDAAGCYPLFSCQRWEALAEDFGRLPPEMVAVSLVADPLGMPEPQALAALFPDVCRAYKDHFVVDLTQPLAKFVSPHHQRNARQAAKHVLVQLLRHPSEHLETWRRLYSQLVTRHSISGVAAFSRESFSRQLAMPGMWAFAAESGGKVVGMTLWIVSGAIAHYHLAAYSDRGYELKASFAMFWESLEALAAAGIHRVGLGSGAGVYEADEGLSRFKRGWSNEVRTAYFCGRVLDRQRYDALVARTGTQQSAYFPAYRTPLSAAAAA
jgi:hypothetical protein